LGLLLHTGDTGWSLSPQQPASKSEKVASREAWLTAQQCPEPGPSSMRPGPWQVSEEWRGVVGVVGLFFRLPQQTQASTGSGPPFLGPRLRQSHSFPRGWGRPAPESPSAPSLVILKCLGRIWGVGTGVQRGSHPGRGVQMGSPGRLS
jgi:hypothetical protein